MLGFIHLPKHRVAALLAAALLASAATPALAQQAAPEAQITDEQAQLNDQAVRSIIEEDYARAVALLEESLLLGEANVTYLNLGRAYQMLGRCDKAREAYASALEAPQVSQPSPQLVDKKVEEYRKELVAECPAEQPAAVAEVVPAEVGPAEAEPAAPAPAAEAPAPALAAAPAGEAGAEADAAGASGWAIGATATGLALVAGGVGMHLWAEAERSAVTDTPESQLVSVTQVEAADIESRADTLDTLSLSMLIAGGVTTAVGTWFWLTADDAETALSVGGSPEAITIDLRSNF